MPISVRGSNDPHEDSLNARALLPNRRLNSRRLDKESTTRLSVHIPFQSEDESIPSERDTWRLFESYKTSAILHTEQYLHHNAAMCSEESQSAGFDSLERVARDGGQVPKYFWDLKAARDNLSNDLEVLQSLSGYMSKEATKGLAKFYAFIAFLAVVASLSGSGSSNGLKRLWGSSMVTLTTVSGYTGFRLSKYGIINLCSGVVDSLLDRLGRNALDEYDRHSLKGRRFQLLWWTYHFSGKEAK